MSDRRRGPCNAALVAIYGKGREHEASDPTADPFILDVLLGHEDQAVRLAAARNPNQPTARLSEMLLASLHRDFPNEEDIAAWQNPGATLAMLAHPDEGYHHAALRVLLWFEREQEAPRGWIVTTLSEHVTRWSAPGSRDRAKWDSAWCTVRTFAQYLAGLFSLPWPTES
ncbi:MAG: hypothetical protein EOO70_02325 [Myxococcaceae bacterium]|nr:MAG: hypothetical protein EOO70_02325 [Myxococcaceae bacterium]